MFLRTLTSTRLGLGIGLALFASACQAPAPRLQSQDTGLLDVRLEEGRSPGSVEDARAALAAWAAGEAWASTGLRQLVARVGREDEAPWSELYEYPVHAEALQFDTLARLQSESVRIERSGQVLALAPGLGARDVESSERATWMSLWIELDENGEPQVVRVEPRSDPSTVVR